MLVRSRTQQDELNIGWLRQTSPEYRKLDDEVQKGGFNYGDPW